jgi:hypothetical protein
MHEIIHCECVYFTVQMSSLNNDNGEGSGGGGGGGGEVVGYTYRDEAEVFRTRTYAMQHNYLELPKCEREACLQVAQSTQSKIVLVLDFDNCGGGTTFFLNTVVSHLKSMGVQFIIVRKYDAPHFYTFTWNDEYEIETNHSMQTALKWVANWNAECPFHRVFVNHLKQLDVQFVMDISALKTKWGIEMSTLTHDFMVMNQNPHIVFPEYMSTLTRVLESSFAYRIQKMHRAITSTVDSVLTQNLTNISTIFHDHHVRMPHEKVRFIEMPDYYKSAERHECECATESNRSVVGIIGAISQVKGANWLAQFAEKMPAYQFVVFGVYDPTYISPAVQKRIIECPYSSIEELNQHLVRYSPVALLELSIWPETYSYTLTLSMLTQLPLFVLRKPASCTVMDRLSSGYADKHFVFSTVDELNGLLKTHAQSYFYTISTTLRFSKELTEWFGADTERLNTMFGRDRNVQQGSCVCASSSSLTSSQLPYVLLLTATVNVSPTIECVYQTSAEERVDTYCKAIRQWMHKTDVRVVVVENSGYAFPELDYLREMYPDRLRILSYVEKETAEARYLENNVSKGASELFSIQYAYRNASWFHEPDVHFVIKLTGRFFIPTFEKEMAELPRPLKEYSALVQNDRERCELVGANVKCFNTVFNVDMFQPNTGKIIRHVETIYKERCDKLPNLLVCPLFAIEPTLRGGYNEKYTTI